MNPNLPSNSRKDEDSNEKDKEQGWVEEDKELKLREKREACV